MLNEPSIALDTLESEKHIVKDLTNAIVETGNQNLKETLKQMRNQAEQDHHEIYKIAEQNGWYMAAANASQQNISQFNDFFRHNIQNQNNQPGQQQNYNRQSYNQQIQHNQPNHQNIHSSAQYHNQQEHNQQMQSN